MNYPIYEVATKPVFNGYKKREKYNNDPLPVPLSDPRFLGLRFEPARPGAKSKDPDYKDRIVADDNKFDIFDVPPRLDFNKTNFELYDVKPFTEYSQGVVFFDLEWIGADDGQAKGDGTDIIVAIGIRYRGKSRIGCNKNKSEKDLLNWFFDSLDRFPEVHTLAGYTIYGFFKKDQEVLVDLGMVHHRCEVNGISDRCPWRPAEGNYSKYRWSNAIVNGKPHEAPAWDCDKYELIDLYPQAIIWDTQVRKAENYRMKTVVKAFGLREESRIEIGDRIYEYWADDRIAEIVEYLAYDLEDPELLWNFLIPQIYFMQTYMPMSLQRLSTTGTGSWWSQFITHRTGVRPQKTQVCGYQGALTYYHAGLFKNCVKLDFSGLYPSIIETWNIESIKDNQHIMLQAIPFMGEYRSKIKKSEAYKLFDGGEITPEGIDANGQQNTAKKLRNSGYGMFNTVGLPYNDPYCGAAVTAYGRNLARYMISWLHDRGVQTHGLDTDGAICSFIQDNYTDEERDNKFKELTKELNATLPGCNKVDYEDRIPFVFIPPNIKETKKASVKLADKLNSIGCYDFLDPGSVDPGLSKNYIYWKLDRNNKPKVANKGKYAKRDKMWIETQFVIDVMTKFCYEGEEAAIAYALEVRGAIAAGAFPVEKLRKTELVKSNAKTLPQYGFMPSEKYTLHYTWRGHYIGKKVLKKVCLPTEDVNEAYDTDFYLHEFANVMKELPLKLPEIKLAKAVKPSTGTFEAMFIPEDEDYVQVELPTI